MNSEKEIFSDKIKVRVLLASSKKLSYWERISFLCLVILKNIEEIWKILFLGIWDLKSVFNEEVFNFSPQENQREAPMLTKKDKLKEEFSEDIIFDDIYAWTYLAYSAFIYIY